MNIDFSCIRTTSAAWRSHWGIALVAIGASLTPARRAAGIDPLTALRSEYHLAPQAFGPNLHRWTSRSITSTATIKLVGGWSATRKLSRNGFGGDQG
jgi:hypothetical protein